MDAMNVVEAWDGSLRAGDWDRARSLLADDAMYLGSEDPDADFNCTSGDQVLSVNDDLITRLEDFRTRESASEAATQRA